MANSLVLRRQTGLAKRSRELRAAQYVRMSTELQRYSIQNQAAAIAAYAQQSNLNIVRTYIDEGRSGVRINRRAGLIELIDDVCAGRADFDHILVYDISRWGRFQDVDESAHYEFICRKHGIKVAYCAEQFDNDGSLLSSIVKNIKRVMAAEYSRELSVKVHTGQCRIASLGFRVGGPVGFGLRRELIGEARESKGLLSKGERKSLQTDRVRLRLGTTVEADVVRWIFESFVVGRKSYAAIARELTSRGTASSTGRRWTDANVRTILRNEAYIGNLVHNRTSRRLGQKQVNNPADQWVRSEGIVDPIIDVDRFRRAEKMTRERRVEIPEEEMLLRLRVLLARKGKLSTNVINDAPGVPSASALVQHFGSLRKAYALIGHTTKRDCNWLDTRAHWARVIADHAVRIADGLRSRLRRRGRIEVVDGTIKLRGRARVTVLTARQAKRLPADRSRHWRFYRQQGIAPMVAVLRLNEAGQDIEDYVLISASEMNGHYLRLPERKLPQTATRAATLPELVSALASRL